MTLPPADVPATPTPLPAVTRGELVQIGETGVTPPEKLLSAPPEYPAVAVRRNAEGVVELRLLVDEDGRVAKLEVVKAVDLLTDAAVEAVRRWTFRPARKHGVPVKMWIAQPVEFRLAR
jgi:protein TonB